MDPNALPFNSDSMLEGLRAWVECESPTWDAAAVNRMMDVASRELVIAGARTERIAGRMGFGDCVRATFPHPRAGDPGILIMGHLDTVHPVGMLQKLPFRREGERAWGPAICDMKGGNYIAFEAIRQLLRASVRTPLPVTVLLTSDEEVGSPSTRDLIEAEATRHRYVLVPEPARPDGGVVTGRYAIARFNLEATGRPSHAGARLAEGRSAIREMARKIIEIEDMTIGRLHLQRRRDPWRAMGELRRDNLHGGGAVDGETPAGPGSRRCADAGFVGLLQRRPVSRHAWGHQAGMGAGRARHGAV